MGDPVKEVIKYCLENVVAPDEIIWKSENITPKQTHHEILYTEYEKMTKAQPKLKKKLKLFNDPIHGSILLNPLEDAIINTPEFYRLREIKQLGGKSHVYPGAVHTRFEHSIGVCHLAGEFVKHLKQTCSSSVSPTGMKMDAQATQSTEETDKELITEEEERCIRIAGLCHDLGHGPFSHVFDDVKKEVLTGVKINHETISKRMFERILLEHPKVLFIFVSMGLNKEHVRMIGNMIDCSNEFMHSLTKDSKGKKKIYLYEIVANKESGMDVDKWDYFARDCYFLGVKNEFDMKRCMTLSKIIEYTDTGCRHIAFRDKEYQDIYGMFRTRCMIHQKACSHKVVSAIEMMIKDAMVAAKDLELFQFHPTQKTLNDILLSVSKKPANLSGYIYLSDNILNKIREYTTGIDSKKAQDLVKNIIIRDTYDIVYDNDKLTGGEIVIPRQEVPVLTLKMKNKLKELHHIRHPKNCDVDDGYEIDCASIAYASEKKDDPVEDIHFYTKEHEEISMKLPQLTHKIKLKESHVTTPKSFVEFRLRLFRKKPTMPAGDDKDDKKALEWFLDKVEKATTEL